MVTSRTHIQMPSYAPSRFILLNFHFHRLISFLPQAESISHSRFTVFVISIPIVVSLLRSVTYFSGEDDYVFKSYCLFQNLLFDLLNTQSAKAFREYYVILLMIKHVYGILEFVKLILQTLNFYDNPLNENDLESLKLKTKWCTKLNNSSNKKITIITQVCDINLFQIQ